MFAFVVCVWCENRYGFFFPFTVFQYTSMLVGRRSVSAILRRTVVDAPRPSCTLLQRAASTSAADEYAQLTAELERIQNRLCELEIAHPEMRSTHCAKDSFYPPKLHHINLVHAHDPRILLDFYRDVMRMDEMPISMFPRTTASDDQGSDVPIVFATDGAMQMHLAQQDLGVGFRNGMAVNPIERGHIAYRTDDIHAFMAHLDAHEVHYCDYGTAFAKEWHQIFFLDPVGTVVEVHAVVG